MANDNRQDEWNKFMERFMPLMQDPEQVLGEPAWQEVTSGGDDLERWWHWDNQPWACSTFDQRDKHSRRAKWYAITDPEHLTEQHLVARLADDGTVLRIILTYELAAGAGRIQVDYKNGKAKPYRPSEEATRGELPGLQVLAEITRATSPRLFA